VIIVNVVVKTRNSTLTYVEILEKNLKEIIWVCIYLYHSGAVTDVFIPLYHSKASNNIVLDCKNYYYECPLNEL
jgi:hypothetical protein